MVSIFSYAFLPFEFLLLRKIYYLSDNRSEIQSGFLIQCSGWDWGIISEKLPHGSRLPGVRKSLAEGFSSSYFLSSTARM
jgi:hypothetical protein